MKRILTLLFVLLLGSEALADSVAHRLGKLYNSVARDARAFYGTHDAEVTGNFLSAQFMPLKNRQTVAKRLLVLKGTYTGEANVVIDESKPARIDVRVVIMDAGFCEVGHIAVFRFANDELEDVSTITTAQSQPPK